MDPKAIRIIFMGTPELAAYVLDELINLKYKVVAVVTAPDRPAGRGRKIQLSAVKHLASRHQLPVLQPENLKSDAFLTELAEYKADLQIVVAFRMLPEAVWNMPPLGTFNLHASLLPDYRGAAPINWVIINGEKETGVTTFMLDHEIDTGKVLMRERIPLDPFETAGSLHDKLKPAGADLVVKTIQAIANGDAEPIEQQKLMDHNARLNLAPKLYKEDCRIDWGKPCHEVCNLIHGLSPVPGAFYELPGKEDTEPLLIRIFEARPEVIQHTYKEGTLITDNRNYLAFATPDGLVHLKNLQLPGKKRMQTDDLLRGYHFSGAENPI